MCGQPDAAKLFVNWLLTKEGQTIYRQIGGYPTVRLDVSSEGALYPLAPADSKAPVSDSEEAIRQQDEDIKIIREIFQPLFRK